jgi:hypothetical protein
MIRGVLCLSFVVALAGTAVAQESPVQVVDKPAATETATPKASKAAAKSHKAKHKAKHKARKHKKARRHGKTSAAAPTPE